MALFEIPRRIPVRRRRRPAGRGIEVLEGRVLLAGGITPAPGSPINGSPGVALTNVTVATFTIADPTGSPGTKWLARVDWGDRTSPDKKVPPTAQSDGSFAFPGNHTYTAAGNYTITVDIAVPGSHTHGTDNEVKTSVTIANQPTLSSITVTPVNPTVTMGSTEQFDAVGTYSDSSMKDLTSQVTWASADPAVATISNASGSKGLATAVGGGSSSITATLGGIIGSTTLTVSSAHLVSIAVTPDQPSVAKGLTEQFTATGTLSDGSSQDVTSQVAWTSANTAVATISNAAGSHGLATAAATGTSTITATLNGISGSTVLAVTPAILVSLAVTPANPSVLEGLTEAFTATGTYSDHSTQNLTNQVTWSSANTAVASITTTGVASGVAPGTSVITASLNGLSGATQLTVTAPIPPPPPLVTITSVQLSQKKHKVRGITVDFSGAVNASEASNLATYVLTTAGKHGSFVAKGAKSIRLKSAVYNAALHEVMLTPRQPFALTKPVELKVKGQPPGGLQDTLGRFIDGDNSGKGSDDGRFVLGRNGAVPEAVASSTSGGTRTIRAVPAASRRIRSS